MRIITPEILKSELSPVQYKAAIDTDDPMLILAGAGSGKTRTIAYKIAHLISYYNIEARRIAAVTFTNKAAKEMKERIGKILNIPNIYLEWMGTFHSLCVRILRICLENPAVLNALKWGYNKNFSIYDEDDQKRMLKGIVVPVEGENANLARIKKIRACISSWKNSLKTPEQVMEESFLEDYKQIANYYAEYQEQLMKANAMDFDDLLLRAVTILEKIPDISAQFSDHFQYMFVDEYQDTNDVQYALLRKLIAKEQKNITVVGDDDQSIYGWRGANLSIIRNFHKDFAPVRIVKLEENYRSTVNIVKAAGAVISHNKRPAEMEKKVFSNQESGSLIHVTQTIDDYAEAESIVEKILAAGAEKYSQTAIFYRMNAQSRLIENALNKRRIPNIIIGGVRFWDRKEIKDVLAYMRLLANPKDNAALLRIINVPARGIGKKTLETLEENANNAQISLWEAIPSIPKLKVFEDLISGFLKSKEQPILFLTEKIIRDIQYKDYLEKDDPLTAAERIGNIDEMLRGIEEFLEENPDATLEFFLQEISLLTSADNKNQNDRNFVTLMTLHSAKGLEFENVHIAGCNAGILPMEPHAEQSEKEKKEDLEEERRLFYVGLTRAKKNLFLYASKTRFWRGEQKYFELTGFIEEMHPETLFFEKQKEVPFALNLNKHINTGRNFGAKKKVFEEKSNQTEGRHLVYDEYSQITHADSFIGKTAQHHRFGKGKVVGQSGSGDFLQVEVLFSDGSKRKFVLKFANLIFS